MLGRLSLLVCAGLLLLGGRVDALEGSAAGPTAVNVVRPEPLPLARVESRLAVYGEKLARWRELGERTGIPNLAGRRPAAWAECLAAVENLTRGYGRLKEELGRGNEPVAELAPWPVLFEDIAFLEGGCGQVYQQVSSLPGAEVKLPVPPPPVAPVSQKPLGEQEQQEKWQRALSLFDAGNYDEAIGEFTGLLNTPQAQAAREKIREAQTEAAKLLRRQAAGILARKGDEGAQKKKLLVEAWTLLNKIVNSYPEAAIIDKVKQNQAQVEIQLDQLDPALLPRLKGGLPPA
jgi:tetratricopeptide (TPR) repeat protein